MSPSAIVPETAESTPYIVPQTQVALGGKVIAITGANRGIGLGIAECCLQNGAEKVYSIDLTERGDEYAALLKRFPGKLGAVTANVTQEESITSAIDKIVEEAGAIHGVVVNAGRTNHKSALDFTKEDVETLFAVNVRYILINMYMVVF
ncbi:uncharacterized protein PV09_09679 [Verruconis gallopava]|uniref:Uncharacterized protein n=1 Tax=Verruconis gallopava TaxID=253628 RepID=A0A0D1ZWZ4_9PEZI|nr:uncharacterized protein PV09_09679 [Verruconis gallopava]KIV98514.1 hypothetical protein PV09_09679 [Verruconis gallopava]